MIHLCVRMQRKKSEDIEESFGSMNIGKKKNLIIKTFFPGNNVRPLTPLSCSSKELGGTTITTGADGFTPSLAVFFQASHLFYPRRSDLSLQLQGKKIRNQSFSLLRSSNHIHNSIWFSTFLAD